MEAAWLKYSLAALCLLCGFLLLNFKNLRILKRLAPSFGGSLAFFSPVIPALNGLHQELRISIHLTPKFAEVRGTLKIRLCVQSLVRLRVLSGAIARWAGRSGLFHRVASGRPAFDAAFQVFAGQESTASSFLQHPHICQDLEELFGYGFSLLVIDKHGIWTEKTDYDRKIDLELRRLRVVLDILRALATGIPRRSG
jgi:hypothetical protein